MQGFIPFDLSFYLIFFCFRMFLSSICYDMWLFVGFCMRDLDGSDLEFYVF